MIFEKVLSNEKSQAAIGLMIGVVFGFLLQKGGMTQYDIIIGQLLLEDFTVMKLMTSAIITTMVGFHLLRSLGFLELRVKPGSWGSSALGGLIFGVGFGLLGYCPGTLIGATGEGSLDALFGGVLGLLAGAGIFAEFYPRLEKGVLKRGDFGEVTIPEVLGINPWFVVAVVVSIFTGLLWWLEIKGL